VDAGGPEPQRRIPNNLERVQGAKDNIEYEVAHVPEGPTATAIATKVEQYALNHRLYYNPDTPDPLNTRYSCPDFVIEFARELNITL
jgi:hypothetical protein